MTETSSPSPDQPALSPADEEFRARQALGLDDGPDIENFGLRTTARDRRGFAYSTRGPQPRATHDHRHLQGKTHRCSNHQHREGFPEWQAFVNRSSRRLCTGFHLHGSTASNAVSIPPANTEHSRSERAGDRLLKMLRWYGAGHGEQTSASVRHQLVCKAICLYLQAPSADEPQEVAGFRWQDTAHWGKATRPCAAILNSTCCAPTG